MVDARNESWKFLKRKTGIASRTLKEDIKKAREGTVKGFEVIGFYNGEDYKRSKFIYL